MEDRKEIFQDQLAAAWLRSKPAACQWAGLRQAGWAAFLAQGLLPTRRQEAYRYTRLVEWLAGQFSAGISLPGELPDPPLATTLRFLTPALAGYAVHLRHGRLVEGGRPEGAPFFVGTLAEGAGQYPELFSAVCTRYAAGAEDPFTALNQAFLGDGLFLYVPAGCVVDLPILITQHGVAARPLMVHPRLVICLGEGSKATVCLRSVTSPFSQLVFQNSVIETHLFAGSQLSWYSMPHGMPDSSLAGQQTQLYAHLEAQARLTHFLLSFAGTHGYLRERLILSLQGEGSQAELYGGYALSGSQEASFLSSIVHRASHTRSYTCYKGVAGGQARGLFDGTVHVPPAVAGVEAGQYHRGWLLGPEAELNVRPQLRIEASDLSCRHGAVVAGPAPELFFYGQSRGLSREAVYSLLLQGYWAEVMEQIGLPAIRGWMEERVGDLVQEREG